MCEYTYVYVSRSKNHRTRFEQVKGCIPGGDVQEQIWCARIWHQFRCPMAIVNSSDVFGRSDDAYHERECRMQPMWNGRVIPARRELRFKCVGRHTAIYGPYIYVVIVKQNHVYFTAERHLEQAVHSFMCSTIMQTKYCWSLSYSESRRMCSYLAYKRCG